MSQPDEGISLQQDMENRADWPFRFKVDFVTRYILHAKIYRNSLILLTNISKVLALVWNVSPLNILLIQPETYFDTLGL